MKLRSSPAFRQNPLKKCEVLVMEQAYHQEGNLRPPGLVEVQITEESTLQEGMAQVAQKMKAMGFSDEQIQKVTGDNSEALVFKKNF